MIDPKLTPNSRLSSKANMMELRDSQTPSPSERMMFILEILKTHAPHLTEWDFICFITDYFAMLSLNYESFTPMAKWLVIHVYEVHYKIEAPQETGVPFDYARAMREEYGTGLNTKREGTTSSKETSSDSNISGSSNIPREERNNISITEDNSDSQRDITQ